MGGLLGPFWGLGTSTVYVLLGMMGLPVFQGGNGGFDYTLGVTGGYIIGFILSTFTVGWLFRIGLDRSKSLWAYIIGTMIIYVPAIIWLSVFDFGWPKEGEMLSQAVYPFVIGDLLKAVIASLFTISFSMISKNLSEK
jgi:biotin transport system substrate-specific component